MNTPRTTIEQIPDHIHGKNLIAVDMEIVYNHFFDRLDTEYECAVYLPNEDALFPYICKPWLHVFLDSFCDIFADAVQDTNMAAFNNLLTTAANIGFYVVYSERVDKAMLIDMKIDVENVRRHAPRHKLREEQLISKHDVCTRRAK